MTLVTNPIAAQNPSVAGPKSRTLPAPSTPSTPVSGGFSGAISSNETLPSIYQFTNYREFLKAFFDAKKAANPAYSAAMFARKAGLGANSRGYLKLVIDGKRNLTSSTIRAFCEALALDAQASIYFENLVLFNQAEKPKDRKYYFERLVATSASNKSEQLELLESQLRYISNWFVLAVRELIVLEGFQEDPAWIAKALKNKITVAEATQAIQDLLRMGLIKRDDSGKLIQTDPLIKVTGGVFNPFIQNFHLGMIARAQEALLEDDYESRNASGVIFSCRREDMAEMKKMVDAFRDEMNLKFGVSQSPANAVIQVNFQIFQLSSPKISTPKKEQS